MADTRLCIRPTRAVPTVWLLLLLVVAVVAAAASPAQGSWLTAALGAARRAGDDGAAAARRLVRDYRRRAGRTIPCAVAHRACKRYCEKRRSPLQCMVTCRRTGRGACA